MRKMRKLTAVLALVAFVFCFIAPVAAMAEEDAAAPANPGSITILDAAADANGDDGQYDLFRIFDLTHSGTHVAYTVNSSWTAFFATGAGAGYLVNSNKDADGNDLGLNPIAFNGETKYINITSGDDAANFANDAIAFAVDNGITPVTTAKGDGEVTVSNLALGYYLVYPHGAADKNGHSDGSVCSLTSTLPDAEVHIKANYPTITKNADKENVELGEVVTYTISGVVPDTTGYTNYTYTVADTMEDGLTFNEDVEVTIGGEEVDVVATKDGNGFTVTIPVMNSETVHAGDAIAITYTATVNENAANVGIVGNANSATLTYSNNPFISTETVTNPPVVTKVYTEKIVITKVDGEDNDVTLQGVKFVLKNSAGKYYALDENGAVEWVDAIEDAKEVTTDADGVAEFFGLKDGTYYVHETETIEGYNMLTEDVTVTVAYAEDGTLTDAEAEDVPPTGVLVTIANFAGTALPSTGGIGTTIFYAVGAALVLGAGVLLVTKRRMSAE